MKRESLFVVDCSVSIAWLVHEQADAYTEAALSALARGNALAPSWWTVETVNVLLVLERRERLTGAQAVQLMRHLQRIPVQLRTTQRSLFELHALASPHQLSSYDAIYLDAALSTGLPVATRDKRLAQAATACGVGVWAP
jgi:predicted nucleic acid-binding protein